MNARLDTYADALEYLCRPIRREDYPPDPLPLRALLARLGHPEHAVQSIRVAGSRGKSTTATLLSNTLQAAGYRVGLFTSPHLHSLRERLRINGEMIDKQAFLDQVCALAPAVESGPGPFSTFELLVALAFRWFAEELVDIVVLEVGVGGRYDATNEAFSKMALLTPIELEHQEMLGYTLSDVATHKAGIIRDSNLVVSAPQPREAQSVLASIAAENEAHLVYLSEIATWREHVRPNGMYRSQYEVNCCGDAVSGKTSLLGGHNTQNIAQVLAWARMVADQHTILVDCSHVVQAAERTRLPGHTELVRCGRSGHVLFDGAHTPASAAALAGLIEELRLPSATYVVSIACDKDLPNFLHSLRIGPDDHLILTMYLGHRAAPLDVLQQAARCVGLEPEIVHQYPDALDAACERCQDGGLVVVTGAQAFVAQAREHHNLIDHEARVEANWTRAVFVGPGYYTPRFTQDDEWLSGFQWLQAAS